MRLTRFVGPVSLILISAALPSYLALPQRRDKIRSVSPKILQAKSAYLDCDCRKEMAASAPSALPELMDWGRYEIVDGRNRADLILLFTMNPYLGDYLTRDGPDKRPALIVYTILNVIDGHTGELLWNDYRRSGYARVRAASKALMHEFRLEVDAAAVPRIRIAP